jgi:hypothetical protein
LLSGKADAQKSIDKFIDYALDEMPDKQNLQQKERSHNTVRNYAFGLKKWFDQNDVRINWNKIEMPTGKQLSMIGHRRSLSCELLSQNVILQEAVQ